MARLRKEIPQKGDERFGLEEDGVLTIRTGESREAKEVNYADLACNRKCIVVPDSLKAFVLRRHHGLPIAGHCGEKKVIAKIRKRFWWKHQSRDVKRWIRACLICRRRKTPRPLTAGTPKAVCLSPHPGHTIAIDLVGPADENIGW